MESTSLVAAFVIRVPDLSDALVALCALSALGVVILWRSFRLDRMPLQTRPGSKPQGSLSAHMSQSFGAMARSSYRSRSGSRGASIEIVEPLTSILSAPDRRA